MVRLEKKERDLWPDYNSKDRIEYVDRPPLPEDVYIEVGKYFTDANYQNIKDVLKPPKDFDLINRIRRAVYEYWWIKASGEGKIDIITLQRPKEQKEAIEEIIRRTEEYLKYCENNAGVFLHVLNERPNDWKDLVEILLKISVNGPVVLEAVPRSKPGPRRRDDHIGYRIHLLLIFEAAKNKKITSITDPETQQPRGEAFEFFSAAFKLISRVNHGLWP